MIVCSWIETIEDSLTKRTKSPPIYTNMYIYKYTLEKYAGFVIDNINRPPIKRFKSLEIKEELWIKSTPNAKNNKISLTI